MVSAVQEHDPFAIAGRVASSRDHFQGHIHVSAGTYRVFWNGVRQQRHAASLK